ncbi:hypothetical protein [Leeia aquatica]|uniref:Nuclear transport factor 2 family protein n=1 Tax=Leeia aquatica TaxID=2725557 RepID=A0A847S9R1_9NEIS|nr:hypothetical protein [Leeia aquatica]NLR74089.1 hypothetical protein [Leeia aquatica]
MSAIKPKCQAVMMGLLLQGMSGPGVASPRLDVVKQQVHRAALQRDYVALRRLMVAEFIWSFGGDGSADQAIAAWKARPDLLRTLSRITAAGVACAQETPETVACPAHAGLSYRAGFVKLSGQWRLAYFVAGD